MRWLSPPHTHSAESTSAQIDLCVSLFKGTSHNNIEATFNEVFVQTAFIPYFPSGTCYFSICDHGPNSLHAVIRDKTITKALHGRLAGRFKPPLAGRCNDFAPSRQKNCHRQKQPSRPGPRKKKTPPRPVPSKKKKKPPRPASKKKKTPRPASEKKQPPRLVSEKKKTRPVPPRKKKQTAPSRHEQQNTPPRGWKLETNTTACLFFSLSCCTFISYCSLVRSIF